MHWTLSSFRSSADYMVLIALDPSNDAGVATSGVIFITDMRRTRGGSQTSKTVVG